ncbi:gastrula zinc finger protein XlCGF57.1 [Austrofundulus limnaeus]|uniref:Gastrula zinc finger protein XlCGF57.1 n=1 Tax=Austrofundulus limnaeus TaxID=52670 RepID=A0A2I4CD49_AUSLI|nr:PREDICTED: gastrula zinc finger protein XlCGF57.1-like [Austrofundulus limnaeus]
MSRLQSLKGFISQRLSAALDDILGHLEKTILEYEEETERRHRDFLDVVLTETTHQNAVVPPDAQQQQLEENSSVANEIPNPEPPLVKKEQEETDITKLTFSHIHVKSEEDEEELQSSLLRHRKTEENEVTLVGEGCGQSELTTDYRKTKSKVGVEDFNETTDRVNDSGSNNRNVFQCSECGKRFGSMSYLKLHIRCHTGEKPFRCPVCRKCFTWKGRLQIHMRVHTGEKPFRCSVCGKTFSESGNLKVHMRVHTGEKPFSCSVCGKGYAQRGNLKMHMTVHKGETISRCGLNRSSHLHHSQTRGMRNAVMTPESAANSDAEGHLQPGTTLSCDHEAGNCGICKKPFGCSECGKRFGFKGQLKTHMRSHTGEKPFRCPICWKCFSWNGCLQKHIKTHTGEKPYRCTVCGKGFVESGNLKVHVRIHTGEKPFSCSICGKRYRQKGSLTKHLEIHREEK